MLLRETALQCISALPQAERLLPDQVNTQDAHWVVDSQIKM